MLNWSTTKRKITDLKPHPKNPRQFTKKGMEDLNQSLDRFGVADPIIINTDGTIIGGHARVKALQSKGAKEVDVRVPSKKLTEKQVEELVVRLNKNVAGE